MNHLRITLIVAAAENNVIGQGNQMPWHLPNDFKYFKKNTLLHSVVMGRKTFESIGKALPERRNIILTKDANYQAADCDIVNSISEVFSSCRDEQEIFIIGGANIYQQFLPLADKVLLTRVHVSLAGDAYFPDLNPAIWELQSTEAHPADERHAYAYSFETYTLKK
ncbi:dihydrofolate reductase [Sphingobacteriaceae bacterium WQ 2009]|uniref:Dihydrofolate reductase n=1 Tax=Rhinopithecimicrobium faecis TaxID=2820698 RepID=A0A8T4H860_9SPHI|nr:dihydrofolate reductase [Sphingobacteriaceae bacterium WQ 2009]